MGRAKERVVCGVRRGCVCVCVGGGGGGKERVCGG